MLALETCLISAVLPAGSKWIPLKHLAKANCYLEFVQDSGAVSSFSLDDVSTGKANQNVKSINLKCHITNKNLAHKRGKYAKAKYLDGDQGQSVGGEKPEL